VPVTLRQTVLNETNDDPAQKSIEIKDARAVV
jgi:hypothetical protein